MALVWILRLKKQSKPKPKPKPRSLGQGNQWRTCWRSGKPARRSSPSLQKSHCKNPAKVPVTEIDGCCRPSTPPSLSSSTLLVSSPEDCPSLLPEDTPARAVYNPWGTIPAADLWAPTSKYYTFLSEYMTSAAASLSSPPGSPEYTPNFPKPHVPSCCCWPSATSMDYTPAKVGV